MEKSLVENFHLGQIRTQTPHIKNQWCRVYWANIEKERELTEKEQRWKRKGWDQFGAQ